MAEIHDKCGVFGVYAPGHDVARLTFFGLYALQHRGQESAGIATCDGEVTYVHKGMGLVTQVFNENNLQPLKGHVAIGHNRYSTTGSSHVRNAQPYLIETIYGPLGVAHNGNLTNALQLRQALLKRGVGLSSSTDSEVITQVLAAPPEVWQDQQISGDLPLNNGALWEKGKLQEFIHSPQFPPRMGPAQPGTWESRIRAFMQLAEGAYCLVLLTREAIYAVRDPNGLRPLCLGKLDNGNFVVASESCALQTVGASYLREVEPGEILRLDNQGLTSIKGHEPKQRALCVFEYVYFARPDSLLEGQNVHQVRQRMGQQLAREAPVEADVVVGVPDSAIPAAIGYGLESGVAYTEGLIKNRYIGRTFIQPDDHLRRLGVSLKYNPLTANLKGKRVVLVDDSIVRGHTAGPMVQLLRDAGATAVHVRVSSPPVCHPCFMGVDMATHKELIAYNFSVEQIRARIGADSIAYLSLEGMLKVIAGASEKAGHCTACFTGHYPISIPDWLLDGDREKYIFEGMWGP